jgi:hypothetical protein
MVRGNDRKIAPIARRAEGIGSAPYPESHFENISKLFLCARNKNGGAVFMLIGKPASFSPLFAETTYAVSTADIKETPPLLERYWKSGIRAWIKAQKRFIFSEEFYSRAQWIE